MAIAVSKTDKVPVLMETIRKPIDRSFYIMVSKKETLK